MRKTKRLLISLAAITMALSVVSPVSAHERERGNADRVVSWASFEQELSFPDAPDANTGHGRLGSSIGWTRLVRTADGIDGMAFIRGLTPGGVYTFWWVSPNEFDSNGDPIIPAGVFVAAGGAKVVGRSGTAFVRMSATDGQASIEGLPALGGALFSELKNPLTSVVRIEVAYHGQAEDAGGDLGTWKSDFWTGTACPAAGSVNLGGQPFCPVYIAATHAGS